MYVVCETTHRMLKTEIPQFLALSSGFIAPIFQTFYFIEVGILCTSSLSPLLLPPSFLSLADSILTGDRARDQRHPPRKDAVLHDEHVRSRRGRRRRPRDDAL